MPRARMMDARNIRCEDADAYHGGCGHVADGHRREADGGGCTRQYGGRFRKPCPCRRSLEAVVDVYRKGI